MATPIPRNGAVFTIPELVRATSGLLDIAGGAAHTSGVFTDTRALTPGSVFVALRGGHQDGHAHLGDAAKAGATVAIVERGVSAPEGLCVIRVPSTLRALGDLARAHARRWREQGRRVVIGITGSAGKTTTRATLAALLNQLFPGEVHCTQGNLNNRIGVPMVLFGLEAHHRFAVIELGTSLPGEITELARIAEPDVGVVTLIASAHLEGLGSIDAVAVEKGSLFRGLAADGVAIGNGDDPRVRNQLAGLPVRHFVYGRDDSADVRIVMREVAGLSRSCVTLARASVGELTFDTPLLGEAGALACAAAVAVAELALGAAISAEVAASAFGNVDSGAGAGRLAPRVYASGLSVIDDTYNANPASMIASIRAADEIARVTGKRLVLVLGEMRELGAGDAAGHDEVGRAVANSGALLVLSVGRGEARRISVNAERARISASHFDDVEQAAMFLSGCVQPDDLVLVKGSRSIGTERVVEALSAAHDRQQLGDP